MELNLVTLAIIGLFMYPVIKGFLLKFSSHSLKQDVQQMAGNIAFIVGLFLGVYFSKRIFVMHREGIYRSIYEAIPNKVAAFIESTPSLLYFVIMPLMIALLYKLLSMILELINRITFYPFLDGIEDLLESKGSGFKRMVGALFQLPRSICYVLIAVFLLNFVSLFNFSTQLNRYLESSEPYKVICKEVVIPITNSKVAKQLPTIINNSFKVVVKETGANGGDSGTQTNSGYARGTIVYYNGVTLEEGVRSNAEIDSFAKELTKNDSTDKDVAKRIYTWVGSNITYDNSKANRVMNNDFNISSGAIPTFRERKGICFDYACLYVAMARANGLKVRLVTGEGFNGVSWVSHAWNQVYISEEEKWISVDPTFYKGGYYFNSKRFDNDHRNAKVVGEW